MIISALKSALFSALAVLLSAGHSVCAGMISDAAPVAQHQHHAATGHDDHAGHAGADEKNMPASQKAAPFGPPRHDCQHCNMAQLLKASVKADIHASLTAPPIEKTVGAVIDTQNSNIFAVRKTRFANFWRGPPDATPISMKIRLLI